MSSSTPIERALITGASAGIGEELARQLAARGSDLVLVARREERLRELAGELGQQHGVDVEVLAADLVEPEELALVEKRLVDTAAPVDLLVNNAGFGAYGAFADLDADRQTAMVDLNVRALVRLSHAAAGAMRARGRGGVINLSSTASFQPDPYGATYGATKAFVQSFTEALYEELRGSGVHVMSLAPGFTITEFQDEAGVDTSAMPAPMQMTAADVVAGALKAYERRKVTYVPGLMNRIGAIGSSLGPSVLGRKMSGLIHARWSGR